MSKMRDISPDLQNTLQHIVDDVVSNLNCMAAMVATLEPDNSLPVRAYATSIAPEIISQGEKLLGLSFIGPKSVSYLDDKKFQDNLSVRAVKGTNGQPKIMVSDSLFDLVRPVIRRETVAKAAQKLSGIKQVIAVPFSLQREVVGNLFAATRSEFTERDINFLKAFGHQAATAIQSQRRLEESQGLERVIFALQGSITDETQTLQIVVDAVVDTLDYAAALVATLEPDNTLPVRAYSVGIA
ncbi:MAG: GAF domain-containing protein, partial [Anaerolineae bacterium]|nr:GAF domain-containing protein [Anaerolineae bacterium]